MSQVSGTIVPSWSSFVYGGEKVAAPRRAQSHVQLRFTLFKGTTRHRPRLHHQARGTGVLRAMIKALIDSSVGLEVKGAITMTTATLEVKGLRTVRYIPKSGEHQLSINLGLADASTVFEFAKQIGVQPEIVQIPSKSGIEIHALLICESLDTSPLSEGIKLSNQLDELTERINPDAIRHVYGRTQAA